MEIISLFKKAMSIRNQIGIIWRIGVKIELFAIYTKGAALTTVGQPRLDHRPEQPYMGIRTQTPMKGMSKVVEKLFKEIEVWAKQHNLRPAGPPFLRYHVIDMAGEMDIEVGIPVETPLPGDGRVSAGELPAGRYASLVYIGSGYTGNKTLIEWARANGHAWDRWDDPKGRWVSLPVRILSDRPGGRAAQNSMAGRGGDQTDGQLILF